MTKLECKNVNERLPLHIMEVIVSKIPIVYFPTCRIICKYWNDLIQNYAKSFKIILNTFFLYTSSTPSLHCIDLNPKRLERTGSTIDFGSNWQCLKIVHSCNGLILLLKYRNNPFKEEYGIFNPMTNEYMKVPISDAEENSGTIFNYGLGYSFEEKCYKVVRVYFDTKLGRSVFEMFSFGQNIQNWSFVDHVPYYIYENAVYLDGALYWIGNDSENSNRFVCRFDIDVKTIEATLSPTRATEVSIKAYNGSIYATVLFDYSIEVWKLQRFKGENSWNREIIFDMPIGWIAWSFRFQLIKDYEDGEIFCLLNESNFMFVNRKCGRMKPLDKDLSIKFSTIFQIESLNFGSLSRILARDDRWN